LNAIQVLFQLSYSPTPEPYFFNKTALACQALKGKLAEKNKSIWGACREIAANPWLILI
jgi:hypothetical protein